MTPAVLISEVGPRDGLQSVKAVMPTPAKRAWIDALVAAGLREIEVGSFVPAARLPQLADTAEVVRHARQHAGLTVMALVPNLIGAQAAVAAGVHKLTLPVSASMAHSLANVRRTPQQMLDEVRAVLRWRLEQAPGVRVEVGLSTAFGCTLQGPVDEDEVIALALALAEAGVDEVGLSDTTGMAHPAQVRRLFTRLRATLGERAGAAHLHNTRGLGLANCLAAFEAGVRTFDASLGGLGGCPYAPGASGNVVTEDLVFMFEAMGVATGVDLDRLMAARVPLQAGLPGEPLYGMLAEAGLPKGFEPATGKAVRAPASEAPHAASSTGANLPYAGTRVVEFTHMVMGPTCGLILGDLGAEVIKVEPLEGDNTRHLLGSGAGFFPVFNRNKKSLAVNVKDPRGLAIVRKLVGTADVFSENFRTGTLERLGLGYDALKPLNPRLVHVSHKGFLPGPYEHRTALDEVVQMMGGLAYMTGPPGQPLRAGASVNDIMGGMFGAIGAMAALKARETSGCGQQVQAALFENNILLVAQHMMQFAVTGQPARPMPQRISAWAVYDVFTVRDGAQIFLAVVSDKQWLTFCQAFGFTDLSEDARLASNNQRVQARDWLMPELRRRLADHRAEALGAIFEREGLPFAPIARPDDLLDDPHLLASGGLVPVTLPDGRAARTPLLPLMLAGQRLPLRLNPPRLGEHSDALLHELGYSEGDLQALRAAAVLA